MNCRRFQKTIDICKTSSSEDIANELKKNINEIRCVRLLFLDAEY